MNLNEAFRYQKFLTGLAYTTTSLLEGSDNNIYLIETTHLKSKAKPDIADEIVRNIDETPRSFNCSVDDLIKFAESIFKERENLSAAISETKKNLGFDYDAMVAMNKVRQELAFTYKNLGNKKSFSRVGSNSDYTFNVEGNQTRFSYKTKSVFTPDFDTDAVRKQAEVLYKEADENSVKIDKALINSSVDYIPPYNVNGSWNDALNVFLQSQPN